jgi:hypothetical protein
VLTEDGQQALMRLSSLHRNELRRMGTALTLPIRDDEPGERPAARNSTPSPDAPRSITSATWRTGSR